MSHPESPGPRRQLDRYLTRLTRRCGRQPVLAELTDEELSTLELLARDARRERTARTPRRRLGQLLAAIQAEASLRRRYRWLRPLPAPGPGGPGGPA